ncbi:hypothetical protein NST64_08615 [Staphylococcus sp. FSL W8-1268]|uniref:hypothetical protein n=1 Tax=Staphylococcus sp. FSL W8-1268 TaxID=2954651 RepID=UPI0030F92245
MIVKVFSNDKSIEIGKDNVSNIEFLKHVSGNIDIYRLTNKDGQTIGWEGFFVGHYKVIKKVEAEQLNIFNILEAK